MRRADIVMALARRHVPLDAAPEVRAAIFREVVSAVRAAGQKAEPALMLTELETGDALVAFQRQVEALAAVSGRRPTRRADDQDDHGDQDGRDDE